MPYRLLQYMLEIWREYLKDIDTNVAEAKDFKLPVIVPLVLYNGSNKWTACSSYKEYLRNSDMFGEYAVDFKYILLNVNGYPDEELLELSNLISMVFLIEKAKDFSEMVLSLKKIIEPLKNISVEEFLMFKHWLINIAISGMSDSQKKEVKESLIDSEEVESMIYNLERAITNELKKYESKLEEAENKIGKMATDTAKKLIGRGIENEIVAEATGLELAQIEKMRKEMEDGKH